MAAAYTGGAKLITSFPWKHIKENLIMNMQMLEAFCLEGVKRVVYVGSATLYQAFDGNIKEEELDLREDPHSAYFGFGWGGRFIEKLCEFGYKKYGLEVLIARVSNIFGPYARFNPDASNFIPAIIRKAVDKMDPFEVWGSPDVVRDVICSEDFARAIVMMMDNDKIKYDTFNIGSGVKTTVKEVVKWALKYAHHKPKKIEYLQDKPSTIKFRVLDCSKAKQILGWEPRYTIEEGIEKLTKWWVENRGWWPR
jgi:GDP-L-fucose synthase